MNETRAHVFQISISAGGVPKTAIPSGRVTTLGIDGDAHHDIKHHGGPERALCLYSLEHIVALQQEGHPVFPGSTGENITTFGLDLASLLPGTRLRIGAEVLAEISSYTSPCRTIQRSFRDRNFNRMSQETHPGWSRMYARVLTEGEITTGDEIILIAAGTAAHQSERQ